MEKNTSVDGKKIKKKVQFVFVDEAENESVSETRNSINNSMNKNKMEEVESIELPVYGEDEYIKYEEDDNYDYVYEEDDEVEEENELGQNTIERSPSACTSNDNTRQSYQTMEVVENCEQSKAVEPFDPEKFEMDKNETIDESISKYTKEQFVASFNDFYNRWIGKMLTVNDPIAQFNIALEFLANNNVNTPNQPYNGYAVIIGKVTQYLLYVMDHENDMTFEEEDLKMYHAKIDKMLQVIYQFEQAYLLIKKNRDIICGADKNIEDTSDTQKWRLTPSIIDFIRPENTSPKYNDKQKLHIRILKQLKIKGYRKYGDYCYEEIKTKNGQPTHAWKQSCKVSDFIVHFCNRMINPENWDVLTKQSRTGVEDMVEKLTSLDDPEFLALKKDRYKFSFRNGIFLARIKVKNALGREKYISKFFPYNSEEIVNVDTKLASAKYHDVDFVDYTALPGPVINGKAMNYNDDGNWYHIPTPTFQKVLDHQYNQLPASEKEMICRWFYVLFGRLMFDIGVSENGIGEKWQAMMYILGEPGTGKSTLYEHVLLKIYDDREIGILDNNMEKQFGLENLLDRELYVLIGQELDENFKLERTTFLRIISGEYVIAARKSKTAVKTRFNCHMGCCGNKMIGYQDNKGELKRRIIAFLFENKVLPSQSDPNMDIKLLKELPAIIQKCVMAYLEYGQKYGSKNIWDILPKYFIESSRKIAERSNPRRAFLESNDIIFGPNLYVSETEFRNRFIEFCKQRNFPRQKFDFESWKSEFQDVSHEKNIKIQVEIRGSRVYPRHGGMLVSNENFLLGLDVKHDEFGSRPPRDESDETKVI